MFAAFPSGALPRIVHVYRAAHRVFAEDPVYRFGNDGSVSVRFVERLKKITVLRGLDYLSAENLDVASAPLVNGLLAVAYDEHAFGEIGSARF